LIFNPGLALAFDRGRPVGGERVNDDGTVFAVVAFDRRTLDVARVVTPFHSLAAADAFARSEGMDAYTVAPVDFPVRPLVVSEGRR
jgi:hypothetical protein